MCGRGPVRLTIGVLLAALAWMSSCTYSPSPESGKLFCGAGDSCPKGYSCADGRTCWKDGQNPPDAGGFDVRKEIVTRPDVPVPPRLTPFIGSWDFESGNISTTCTDNSVDTRDLTGDFMDIGPGTDSDLIASFFCDWRLNVLAGKTVLARAGQTCTTVSMGTTFTWTAVSFEFATGDGENAVFTGRINAALTDMGTPITCMLTMAGTPNGFGQAVLARAP